MAGNQLTELESLRSEVLRLREEITELTATNATLRAVEQRYQAAFTNAPYQLTLVDVPDEGSFSIVESNLMTRKTFGVSTKVNDEANRARFAPETIASFTKRLQACSKAGHVLEFYEELIVGGSTFWMQSLYTPVGQGEHGTTRVLVTSFDHTQRNQQQQQEAAERELLLAQQSQILAEISTPLLTLSHDVLVLPLIGAIDTRRSQQIMEVLLEGVAQMRARTAIIDITGVEVVDTQVANALLRAAQAVQLLGARVILTGIRPEIAQTLVGLGLDLSGIITRSTLQAAVAFSLGNASAA